MKTLAVLSALATIAIAAPALEEYGDSTRLASKDFTITQREKKSTLGETLPGSPSELLEDHAPSSVADKFASGSSSARTFSGFKKPIIVKKKIGYHVYRDSDEERAQVDARESCKNPIKVKLCDDITSVDKIKSGLIHNTHEEISESEMKNSINMAKEAVETFQKDLLKMDHESPSNGHMHTRLNANRELREDIEKARQALEHIQKKFKNLDKDNFFIDGGIPESNLKTKNEEEERMTQWKETLGNHKSLEIARNLEDNFKTVNENKVANNLQTSDFIGKDMKSIEDTRSSKSKEEKNEDDMISIVDKTTQSKIHSDNLKKENFANAGKNEEEIKHSMLRKANEEHDTAKETPKMESAHIEHSGSKSSVECNDNGHETHQHANAAVHKERSNEIKSTQSEKNNRGMKEKHTWDKLENIDMVKSSENSPVFDKANNLQGKSETKLHNDHLRSEDEKDHKIDEEKLETSASTTNSKIMRSQESNMKTEEISTKTDKHEGNEKQNENTEQRSTLLKQSTALPEFTDQSQVNKLSTKEIDLQRSVEKPTSSMTKSVKESILGDEEKKTDIDHGSLLSTTIEKLDNEKSASRNHIDEHQGNNDHQIASNTRVSSNIHKDLLNNMDFIDDSHQSSFDKHSTKENNHKLKNEKLELQERLNVPQIQPNADHLRNMIQLSDNSQDHMNQGTQLKMATMFNNEQPNLNVQFNSPQTFEQQTNIQRLLPFKAAEDIHNEHELDFDTVHNRGEISSDLHDPLQIRWAHENHPHKIIAASQFHPDNMEMGASSPHFSVDRSMPLGSHAIDDSHRVGLNEQLNSHQRWMQEKNINAAVANIGQHDHGNLNMMQRKSSMNSAIQQHNLMQMRGGPNMALEPNQWAHDHGVFRSSYGPSSYGPSSYGTSSYGSSSYGPSSSGTSGSSASGSPTVGLFPNVNVGNYAVPLLLSCSPSVVSGRLAKANSYNSAPSYRSDDFNFLKKRDTDIALGIPNVKVHRHTSSGHQSTTVLEKKL